MSILGLGRVMNRDVVPVLEQIKTCLRYGGAIFLYALNTKTAFSVEHKLFFEWNWSSPKYRAVALYGLLKKNRHVINFAALL